MDHRLLLGLAVSTGLHLLFLLSLGPRPVKTFELNRPFLVEVRALTVSDDSTNMEMPKELPKESVKASHKEGLMPDLKTETPHSATSSTAATKTETTTPAQASDRYFTTLELDVHAEQINDVDLVYPKRAYAARTKGRVVLTILINETGTVDDAIVNEAHPPGVFEEAVLTAAHALQFRPAIKQGRYVKSQKTIEVLLDPYERINVP